MALLDPNLFALASLWQARPSRFQKPQRSSLELNLLVFGFAQSLISISLKPGRLVQKLLYPKTEDIVGRVEIASA